MKQVKTLTDFNQKKTCQTKLEKFKELFSGDPPDSLDEIDELIEDLAVMKVDDDGNYEIWCKSCVLFGSSRLSKEGITNKIHFNKNNILKKGKKNKYVKTDSYRKLWYKIKQHFSPSTSCHYLTIEQYNKYRTTCKEMMYNILFLKAKYTYF